MQTSRIDSSSLPFCRRSTSNTEQKQRERRHVSQHQHPRRRHLELNCVYFATKENLRDLGILSLRVTDKEDTDRTELARYQLILSPRDAMPMAPTK